MKKLVISFFLLLPLILHSAPQFKANTPYLITCYATNNKGGIVPGESLGYPLVFNENAFSNTADAYWLITEKNTGQYTIKNVSTGKYIKYMPDNAYKGKKNVELVDDATDSNTLWSLSLKEINGISYYIILPTTDLSQAIDKRGGEPYAVGTSGMHGNANQCFAFIDKSGNEVKDSEVGDIIVTGGSLDSYLKSITFNEKPLIYNATDKNYFFSIPLDQMDTEVTQYIQYSAKNGSDVLAISGKAVANNTDFSFGMVTAEKAFVVQIRRNGQTVMSTNLIFTGLPIVQLYSEGWGFGSNYSAGSIRVNEPDKLIPGELYNMEAKWRGATALSKPKKSYSIKLKDANGEKMHKSFFGLREDNNWILDAMAIDPMRMRNRVATDLWNEFSTPPYYNNLEPNVINGTRGQFVEVFLNDEYIGLYCMTEKIDRKQLKLKKYDDLTEQINGVLYKSYTWSWSVFMGHEVDEEADSRDSPPGFNNTSEEWGGYEAKYPDKGDGQKLDWQPIWDVVNFVGCTSPGVFAKGVEKMVDLPVFVDYYLFSELMMASDNHGKNLYFYFYDKNDTARKMDIAPWDLDGVFGRRWESSAIGPKQDFTQFIVSTEHGEHMLYTRLKKDNVAQFNDKLKTRYLELANTYFHPLQLIRRFKKYKDAFDKSGAGNREEKRWSGRSGLPYLDFDYEEEYLTDWLYKRTDYLDKQYGVKKNMPVITIVKPDTVTYGDAPFKFSISSTNTESPLNFRLSAETVLRDAGNNTLEIIKSGDAHIIASQIPTDEFGMIDTAFYIKVNKKQLYAIAEDDHRMKGEENPEFSVIYEGLVNGDFLEDVLVKEATASCVATPESDAGKYPIVVTGGALKPISNYKLFRQNGTLTVSTETGVEDETLNAISVYPNPVLDELTVKNLELGSLVQIYNAEGVCVYSNKAFSTTIQIPFANIAIGTYYLKIGTKSYTVIKN